MCRRMLLSRPLNDCRTVFEEPLTLALSPDYDSTELVEVRGEGISKSS
jgi:hypothetical protein